MSNQKQSSAGPSVKTVVEFVLGDIECYHCDAPLPEAAKARAEGTDVVMVECPTCRCLTPFRIVHSSNPSVK